MNYKARIRCCNEDGVPVSSIYQWDTGRRLTFPGADITAPVMAHFETEYHSGARVVQPEIIEGILSVSVPDAVLRQPQELTVRLVDTSGGNRVICSFLIPVIERERPDGYIYNREYQELIGKIGDLSALDTQTKENLVAAINEVLAGSGIDPEEIAEAVEAYMAEHPFAENDPTVPEWAKEPEKPEYTPQEVGADPAGTAAVAVAAHDADEDAHEERFAQKASAQSVSALTGRVAAIEGKEADWDAKQDAISDLDEIRQNAENGATAAEGVVACLQDILALLRLAYYADAQQPSALLDQLESDLAELSGEVVIGYDGTTAVIRNLAGIGIDYDGETAVIGGT